MHACVCMHAYASMHMHAYACICKCMHACACTHMQARHARRDMQGSSASHRRELQGTSGNLREPPGIKNLIKKASKITSQTTKSDENESQSDLPAPSLSWNLMENCETIRNLYKSTKILNFFLKPAIVVHFQHMTTWNRWHLYGLNASDWSWINTFSSILADLIVPASAFHTLSWQNGCFSCACQCFVHPLSLSLSQRRPVIHPSAVWGLSLLEFSACSAFECACACMRTHACAWMWAHAYACKCMPMHSHACIRVQAYACMHTYTRICVLACACMHIHACHACIGMHAYACLHAHARIYTHVMHA